ncbi:hypothetical protein AAC387_Pa01g0921 [Persea americana]
MVCLSSLPLKRGRRGIAGVIFLVFVSMVVPLIFLLGINTRLHPSTRWGDSEPDPGFRNFNPAESGEDSEVGQSEHLDMLLRKFGPELSKEVIRPIMNEVDKETINSSPVIVTREPTRTNQSSGGMESLPTSVVTVQKQLPDAEKEKDVTVETTDIVKGVNGDESKKSCQLEFGSYCAWRKEHKEDMKDSMVKKLKDQLFIARAYYPTIAKLPSQDRLSREMKQNIQDFERIFSEASTDADLPLHVEKRRQKMGELIHKAKSFPVDCNNVDKKLRQILDLTEDEAHFHMKQSAFLYQLAVQTKPKSHHCLSMRLTVEYFRSHSDKEFLPDDKNGNPALYNYVIFSNNVLASSVVINSTVMHAKESEKQVFHVITDGQNYAAMKLWFLRSSYRNATIYVLNIEDVSPNYLDSSDAVRLSFSDEFRVSVRNTDKPLSIQMRTEYVSVFGPAHFMLPEIFQDLERVVVLDDDVVVQQDLSALWSLEMEGKVNGAVEYCGLRLGQLKSYLGDNTVDNNACAWMSALNVIDLKKWRELNLTDTYRRLLQALQSENEASSGVASLHATLLTFQNQIYALQSSWALSGLGHDYGVDAQTIKEAAVLHYNGKMKPWLDLGISKYKGFWKKFLKRDDQFMDECNVNP